MVSVAPCGSVKKDVYRKILIIINNYFIKLIVYIYLSKNISITKYLLVLYKYQHTHTHIYTDIRRCISFRF